jgi:hypothetical protein
MTITEALSIPNGMGFEEYEKLLIDKKRLERQIAKISSDIDFEVDSLEVLADEAGSDRYNKHLHNKQQLELKIENAQENLNEIKRKIEKI